MARKCGPFSAMCVLTNPAQELKIPAAWQADDDERADNDRATGEMLSKLQACWELLPADEDAYGT
jgi:hypothetical protein